MTDCWGIVHKERESHSEVNKARLRPYCSICGCPVDRLHTRGRQ